jgi:hypothetical protein
MSTRNGEKARAAIEKRRRTAQRLKDRAARAGTKPAAAAPRQPKKS